MFLPQELKRLLQMAYSAERAAAYAFMGHAKVVRSIKEKHLIQQIEQDEWHHREEVLKLMQRYHVNVSKRLEFKFACIGKIIGWSSIIIGWFISTYFAALIESGNVNEYFRMKSLFNAEGIFEHDELLTDFGLKEKEHEVILGEFISKHKWLPFFQRIFKWSPEHSFNDF